MATDEEKQTFRLHDNLTSALASTSDIQRWLLMCALDGRVSRNRKHEMKLRAQHLVDIIDNLPIGG